MVVYSKEQMGKILSLCHDISKEVGEQLHDTIDKIKGDKNEEVKV